MNWLSKLFSNEDKPHGTNAENSGPPPPEDILAGMAGVRFGRYSDNNKTLARSLHWYDAEDLFKEKKYNEALVAFFAYLADDEIGNVTFSPTGDAFTFSIVQGSKKIEGRSDGSVLTAIVPLAYMPEPITAVMRRLLEVNFNMSYCRAAINDGGMLVMLFESDITSLSNNKIFYALRELAAKSDRLDALLLSDFPALQPAATAHMQPLPGHILDVQYIYFQKWINEGLEQAAALNQDSFSGAIAYLLPLILYRIDFLINPEAKMQGEMERISSIYWAKKEELTLVERNQQMKDGIRKLQAMTKDEFAANVYRTVATFAITAPPKPEKIKDYVYNANKDSKWYIEHKYPEIALDLVEYGLLYCQFMYSMPAVSTGLITIFMAVMHPAYFDGCGMAEPLYSVEQNAFNRNAIENGVEYVLLRYRDRFKNMKWDHNRIRYENRYEFAISFSEQIANLNLETKR